MTSRAIRSAAVAAALVPALVAPVAAAMPTPTTTGASTVLMIHVNNADAIRSVLHRSDGVVARHTFPSLRAFSVRVPAAAAGRTAARLRALPGVTAVERTVERQFLGAPTDDPGLTRQLPYLSAVAAPAAWARQHASAAVRIAVIDSGVDVGHPDLAGKIVAQHNAVDGSTRVTDRLGHGTFVAGVAAAATNNAVGVAGAAYDADVVAVKIADADGAIQIDDEVAGIRWATAQHVDVINLSLGGPDASSAERAAIADAQKAGVLVVAAAGNDGETARSYPAAYPGVVAVGATDVRNHTRASFSNYGSWVSVAAPGVGIYSTVPPAGSALWTASQSRTGYAGGDGTSFSTPLVAGEAALLKAQNPHATAAQLRHAITASAHGYAHLGLGTGQVDFAGGLRHLPPASLPSAPQVLGASARLRVSATSSAPRIAFRWDDQPRHRSVAVAAGTAGDSFLTWGLANGPHTVGAYDCTAYDECSYAGRSTPVALANPAPVITAAPALTGRATVRVANAIGGPVRLLVDGHLAGVIDRAPYTFPLDTSALTDGRHVLTAQGCSADHKTCRGPVSAPVTVTTRGLHPSITGLTPSHVSPNGDRTHDAATLSFTLPDRETVRMRVLDGSGTLVRTSSLVALGAGRHTWTWRARRSDGRALPDGAYTLALDTARGDRRGWVTRAAVVDTHRPLMSTPTGGGARIYPYPDGYRDTFTTRTRLSEPATLTLTVRTAAGRLVRTVRVHSSAGAASVSWNGRDGHGRRVAAGRYQWQLTATDAAGNPRRSRTFRLDVSAKRLRQVTVDVAEPAGRYTQAGGTSRCAYARSRESAFAGGLHLVNGCSASSYDLAFADYSFRLPGAVRYASVTFQVRGLARQRPSEITAAFDLTDGSTEIPRYVTLRRPTIDWTTVGRVPAAGHVFRGRKVHISLLLDTYFAGRNDLDAAQVRARVAMTVLR